MRLVIIALATALMFGCSVPAPEEVSFDSLGLSGLKEGMSRMDAERIIAKARGQKSRYDLRAMDMSPIVKYPFASGPVLVVNYKPGRPAKRGIRGKGNAAPLDGTVISFELEKDNKAIEATR